MLSPKNSLLRQGLHVIATARNSAVLNDLLQLNDQGGKGKISTLSLDVTDEERVKLLLKEVEALTGGRLDILVNNAGHSNTIPALDTTLSDIRVIFNANFLSIMNLNNILSPLLIRTSEMLATYHQSNSLPVIVTPNSLVWVVPHAFGATYNSSKAVLCQCNNTLRLEIAPSAYES